MYIQDPRVIFVSDYEGIIKVLSSSVNSKFRNEIKEYLQKYKE